MTLRPFAAAALAALLPALAGAQPTNTVRGNRLTIGPGSPTPPTVGTVKLSGLGSSGGTTVLLKDGSDNIIARALAKADLPSAIAYEDEANTFTGLQTMNAGLATTTFAASGLSTFNDTLRSLTYTSQTTGWAVNATGEGDFRRLYTDELHAREFIADLEMALNGGQTIAKSTVVLAVAFTCPAAGGTATLRVRDFPGFPNIRTFATNDWVVLRTFARTDGDSDGNTDLTIGDCVGQVSSYADQADNTQTWTFTRGSGGSAGGLSSGTVIAAEALVIDYGVSGQGFLLARANDGAEGANSPYWQINTWTTAPVAANMAARMRCGNLNGSYGYASIVYGCAFGDSAGTNVTIDPANGFRVRTGGTTVRFQADTSGNVSLTGDLIGTGWRIRNTDGINLITGSLAGGLSRQIWWSSSLGGTPLGTIYDTGTEFVFYRPDGATRIWNNADGVSLQAGGVTATQVQWNLVADTGTATAYVELVGTSAGATLAVRPQTTDAFDLGTSSLRWREIYFSEPTTTSAGLFPLVTNSGRIMAKSNGLNGTTTCAGGQRVSSITFAFGIATAITCS